MTIKIELRVDGWISEDGFHIFVEDQEDIISFFKMANEFIESHCVPTFPPTIRQDGRESIAKMAYLLESTAGYLRNQASAITDWENHMGHRD